MRTLGPTTATVRIFGRIPARDPTGSEAAGILKYVKDHTNLRRLCTDVDLDDPVILKVSSGSRHSPQRWVRDQLPDISSPSNRGRLDARLTVIQLTTGKIVAFMAEAIITPRDPGLRLMCVTTSCIP